MSKKSRNAIFSELKKQFIGVLDQQVPQEPPHLTFFGSHTLCSRTLRESEQLVVVNFGKAILQSLKNSHKVQTADQSGCWENGFSADFLEYFYFIPEMKPISNIAYQIQYLTIFCILDLQENIYKKIKKTYYMSAGESGF